MKAALIGFVAAAILWPALAMALPSVGIYQIPSYVCDTHELPQIKMAPDGVMRLGYYGGGAPTASNNYLGVCGDGSSPVPLDWNLNIDWMDHGQTASGGTAPHNIDGVTMAFRDEAAPNGAHPFIDFGASANQCPGGNYTTCWTDPQGFQWEQTGVYITSNEPPNPGSFLYELGYWFLFNGTIESVEIPVSVTYDANSNGASLQYFNGVFGNDSGSGCPDPTFFTPYPLGQAGENTGVWDSYTAYYQNLGTTLDDPSQIYPQYFGPACDTNPAAATPAYVYVGPLSLIFAVNNSGFQTVTQNSRVTVQIENWNGGSQNLAEAIYYSSVMGMFRYEQYCSTNAIAQGCGGGVVLSRSYGTTNWCPDIISDYNNSGQLGFPQNPGDGSPGWELVDCRNLRHIAGEAGSTAPSSIRQFANPTTPAAWFGNWNVYMTVNFYGGSTGYGFPGVPVNGAE